MSRRHNVTGNEGWAGCSGTGPSLFRSPLTHSKWFCLALSLCWQCQVLMPIRLLSTNGHHDDMPPHIDIGWHSVTVELSPACFTGVVLNRLSRKVHLLCLFALLLLLLLFSHCITVTSLTYLTHFLWDLFCSFLCVIGVLALSCWWGSPVYLFFWWVMPVSVLGHWPLWKQNSPANNEERYRL